MNFHQVKEGKVDLVRLENKHIIKKQIIEKSKFEIGNYKDEYINR